MKFWRLGWVTFLISGMVMAESAPSFPPLEATTPPLTAIYKWHQALVAGDFDRYQWTAFELFGWSPAEGTRQRFDQLRSDVPPKLWVVISLPTSSPPMQEVHLIGCSGTDVVLAAVTIAPMAGASVWKVISSRAFVKPDVPSTFVCPTPAAVTATAESPAQPPITPRTEAKSGANLMHVAVPLPGQAGDQMPGTVYSMSGMPQSIHWGYIQSMKGDRLTIASGSATEVYQLTPSTQLCLSGTASKKFGELARQIGKPVSVIFNPLGSDKPVVRVDNEHVPMDISNFGTDGPRLPDCK